MKNFVEKILEKNNCANSSLILAVSGGPDSMCMLNLIADISKRLNLRLIIAHVNHSLRGKESDADEKFVIAEAKRLNLKIETKKINIPRFKKKNRLNLEEAARIKRYEFLRRVRDKYKAKFIVLAHNATDNAETILLNFIRGASLRGLSGMQELSKDILRPLLPFSKKEIEKYCKSHHIKFRVDKSNFDASLKRNFIRHRILPEIEKISPSFYKIMARKSRYFKEAHEFLSLLTKTWLKKHCKIEKNRILCDSKSIAIENDFFKKLVIENIYESFNGSTKDLEEIHINELLSIINKNVSNKGKEIGSRIGVKKIRGQIVFYKPCLKTQTAINLLSNEQH